jgi:uncharacterized membrane protein
MPITVKKRFGMSTKSTSYRRRTVEITMSETKPWWQSTTIAGIIVILITMICRIFGIELSIDDSGGDLNNIVMQMMELVGIVMATVGRINATKAIG